MIAMAKYARPLTVPHSCAYISPQEGLKAHEGGGGQHHANPFDMFQNFFGGGREFVCCFCDELLMNILHRPRPADSSWADLSFRDGSQPGRYVSIRSHVRGA